MIRCGPITSQQLKQFCQGVTEGPSRKLVISQARELAPSEYANHASTDPMTQEPVYVFDKEALQSLAQMTNSSDFIDDGEHLISQRTYTLHRRQVALVAEQLGIPSQQLRAAISKVLVMWFYGLCCPRFTSMIANLFLTKNTEPNCQQKAIQGSE
jgi:hypothetical protein